MEGLCLLVLASSVLLALVPFLSQPLLSLSVDAFDNVSIGGFAGSLFGVLALVAVPVLMLGAVSPWAIRLKLERVEDSGETAGRMYAISTVGSLLGTFSASLLLIPLVGTHRTFLTYAILLAVTAALGLGRRWALAPVGRRAAPARPGRRGQGGGRRTAASSTRPRRRTSTRASSSTRTAAASSSSTRARRSTRSGGRTRC